MSYTHSFRINTTRSADYFDEVLSQACQADFNIHFDGFVESKGVQKKSLVLSFTLETDRQKAVELLSRR